MNGFENNFTCENFHLCKADQTTNDGGLFVYIRSDLTCEKKKQARM
jgi:hypothetical protein